MGFTTAAFIRKNTPELRKKLEKLGYKSVSLIEDRPCLFTASYLNAYHSIPPEWFDDDNPHTTYNCAGRIDCGTNEELFLAIAALRDDTNENQWFTNGEEWAYHPKTECCSPCNTVYRTLAFDYIPKDTNMVNYHKATVKELIEHFKEKEVNHG